MNDQKKTELWLGLVSKHTAEAKAKAVAAGSVAKETTPDGAPAAGSDNPATTPTPDGDPLVALTKRLAELEAKLGEVSKAADSAQLGAAKANEVAESAVAKATEAVEAAVAKATNDQAMAKAEADKIIADAKAVADRIEALAPRGAGKRIDEVGKGKDTPAPAAKTEAELLAENAPNVLKMAEGAK